MSCVDGSNKAFHTESIASWAMKAGKDAGKSLRLYSSKAR